MPESPVFESCNGGFTVDGVCSGAADDCGIFVGDSVSFGNAVGFIDGVTDGEGDAVAGDGVADGVGVGDGVADGEEDADGGVADDVGEGVTVF